MSKIHNIVFFEPGNAHLSSFSRIAELYINLNILKTVPIVTKEKCEVEPFWKIVIEVPDDEVLFWFGMNAGFDICRSNRSLMVGCD